MLVTIQVLTLVPIAAHTKAKLWAQIILRRGHFSPASHHSHGHLTRLTVPPSRRCERARCLSPTSRPFPCLHTCRTHPFQVNPHIFPHTLSQLSADLHSLQTILQSAPRSFTDHAGSRPSIRRFSNDHSLITTLRRSGNRVRRLFDAGNER
jgi:hypothetical protein